MPLPSVDPAASGLCPASSVSSMYRYCIATVSPKNRRGSSTGLAHVANDVDAPPKTRRPCRSRGPLMHRIRGVPGGAERLARAAFIEPTRCGTPPRSPATPRTRCTGAPRHWLGSGCLVPAGPFSTAGATRAKGFVRSPWFALGRALTPRPRPPILGVRTSLIPDHGWRPLTEGRGYDATHTRRGSAPRPPGRRRPRKRSAQYSRCGLAPLRPRWRPHFPAAGAGARRRLVP